MSMVAVAGYGAAGRALVARLAARGQEVVVVQRRDPGPLPAGARFRAGEVATPEGARAALAGASAAECAVGIRYTGRDFLREWPAVAAAMLDACAGHGARFLLADNLYMYGPQTAPLHEDMALTSFGEKPRARAEVTRLWQAAHAAGRVQAAAVRASDFYGPGVRNSVISEYGVARLVAGKAAMAPWPPDQPHDFTNVPDFAAALETLIDAPEADWGQAWHAPNAGPTRSLRAVLAEAAAFAGAPFRLTVLPDALRRLLGLFDPIMAGLGETRFQWDRPYLVDTSKWAARFGTPATPFAEGLAATVAAARG